MYRYRAKVLACKSSFAKIEEQKIEMSLGAFLWFDFKQLEVY